MKTLFHLQIVNATTGELIRFPGGTALERDLVAACAQGILDRTMGLFPPGGTREDEFIEGFRQGLAARPVGILRSQQAVIATAETVLRQTLARTAIGMTRTEDQVRKAVSEGLTAALLALKADTRFVVK